jgi:hypothetical protein
MKNTTTETALVIETEFRKDLDPYLIAQFVAALDAVSPREVEPGWESYRRVRIEVTAEERPRRVSKSPVS